MHDRRHFFWRKGIAQAAGPRRRQGNTEKDERAINTLRSKPAGMRKLNVPPR